MYGVIEFLSGMTVQKLYKNKLSRKNCANFNQVLEVCKCTSSIKIPNLSPALCSKSTIPRKKVFRFPRMYEHSKYKNKLRL